MHNLSDRHIGPNITEQSEMLKSLGVESLDKLIEQTIPADILLKTPIDLPSAISEHKHLAQMNKLAFANKQRLSLIGRGWYETITPAVLQRNILENPVWYTSYTPYQAEVSQGRLEALFLFQTAVSDMTGLPLANCSMLDEATAAAESATMIYNLRSREQIKRNANKIFIDYHIFPEVLAVMQTRAKGQELELVIGRYDDFEFDDDCIGAIVQYPNADGSIEDYADFVSEAHEHNCKVAVEADLMALALLKSPGSWGADICFGTTQRWGIPMGFGGPSAAYMATRNEYKRELPGRIIGLSKDTHEHPAYRLALQTREQHIKRERATSNICTAQALTAIMAGMYCAWHGAEGIRRIALDIHGKTVYLNEMLQAYGYTQENAQFFDTLKLHLPQEINMSDLLKQAEKEGVDIMPINDDTLLINIGEGLTIDDMNAVFRTFICPLGMEPIEIKDEDVFNDLWAIDESMEREVDYLQHPVFQSYHTETEMMRYLKRLDRKDISLTHSMIPLGSCTMKLNPASAMIPITMQGFMHVHPLSEKHATGYTYILNDLKDWLCRLTGFDACTLQPTSGAAGEYTGLVVICAALEEKYGVDNLRKRLLIPESAHGTNPASCVQAGFIPIVVKCDELGNIDLSDWQQKAIENADTLAGCMITYPSTHGIFEQDVRQLCDIIHHNGGFVYMDGANMNAQVGLTNPATIGADVCHLNLHKTFASPHGGGGPGVGAVCVSEQLKDFLPSETVNRVSSALYGNANMALISYGYLRMMGIEGLTEATKIAILNANYLAQKLEGAYSVLYRGKQGRVGHELILDCRQFKSIGITETDIAKRLMDYGYHAPTLSFPVHGTLMIEPTESESLAELDRFVDAMLHIREEIAEVERGEADAKDNVLLNAPHAEYEAIGDWSHSYSRQKAYYPTEWVAENKFWIPVCRVDNGFGDRNLVARF